MTNNKHLIDALETLKREIPDVKVYDGGIRISVWQVIEKALRGYKQSNDPRTLYTDTTIYCGGNSDTEAIL